VAITVVGSLDSSTGTAPTTLTLTAVAAVGDARVFRHKVNSTTIAATALSGGNCTSWTQVAGPTNDNQGTVARHAIWIGTVVNANSSQHETITITWSASISGISVDLDCQTFSNSNTATTWAKDGSASGLVNNASSTTITYPSLTAAGTGELYAGFARASTGGAYGNPAGGTSRTDANGNPAIYLLNAGSGTVAPTQTSNATISNCMGVLLIASAGPVTNTKTLSVTGVGAVSLTKAPQLTKAVTGAGTVSLLRQFNRPLTVTGAGVVSLKKSAQAVKAVTGVGAASLVKLDTKPNLMVVGVGSVSLLRAFVRTLSVVGVGVVSLAKTPGKVVAVTGIGVVSLAKVDIKALNVVGVGSVTVAKLDSKLLTVTGVGVASLLRQFNRSLGVVGVGLVSGPVKVPTKVVKVTGVGAVVLAKLDAKVLGVTGAGVVSITQLLIAPGRVAYVTLYDTGLYTVTMADEGVAVVVLQDEALNTETPADQAFATVFLTDTSVATVRLADEHVGG
jgi:hypothetical protein